MISIVCHMIGKIRPQTGAVLAFCWMVCSSLATAEAIAQECFALETEAT